MQRRKQDTLELINFISKSKNLDKEIIISFLLNSITRIIHSQLDPEAQISLEVVDNQLILTNHNKLVIPDEEDYVVDSKVVDIHLSEAQKINPDVKVNDHISSQILFDDFSRSTYSKIEHSFRIEILNWEKRRIYEKYQPLIGTTVEAKLEDDFGGRGAGATFILEDGTHCYMPAKYQNKAINLSDKKYHNLTIEEVYENSKNFQVLVSNDSPQQIRELLKNEIPEIAEGIIQIVGISRIKGERAKISFRQNPKFEGEIDVLGSIIGPESSRINRIHELSDEKIDVILYSDNVMQYITNALSPARIVSIVKKPVNNGFLVVVPNNHNTLAIGRKGLNVKLAVELISVNIDICSYSYAIEHKIPINWNGNIKDEAELAAIEAAAAENNQEGRRQRQPRKQKQQGKSGFFMGLDEFEKEIAEYNSEISSYEPLSFSNTGQISVNEFEQAINQELEQVNEEIQNSNSSTSQEEVAAPTKDVKKDQNLRKANNANFKFDKDIAGDIDFSDYDFSDFDDDF